MSNLAESDPGPRQAVVLVVLIYIAASAVVASARRYGLQAEAGLLSDAFYLVCSIALIRCTTLGARALRRVQLEGVWSSLVLGTACGATSLFLLLWKISEAGYQPSPMSATEVFHSVVAAPLTEEILFTGLLFTAVRSRLALPPAVFIVALWFTLAHLPNNWISFGLRFVYMTCSCLLLERFRSLSLNVGMHSIYNGLPMAIGHFPFLFLPVLPYIAAALPYAAVASSASALLFAFQMTRAGSLKPPNLARQT